MNVDKTQHPFSSDRPIATREADLLGRANFSEALAAAIKSWKGKDSLVIGLHGHWGSGKTSVKNMVLESLRSSSTDCPEIVEFNPWQWAGQEQLANAFFEEIGKVLGRETGAKTKQIAKKWKLYGAGLHLTAYVATGFRNALFVLLLVIAMFGIGGATVHTLFSSWLVSAIGYGALGLAILTKWGGGFAEKFTAVLDASSAVQEKALAELKRELAVSLQGLDRPVLVVVDDVDRLSADEIRLLFQLIKANADFPNLVYLVLFQLDIVQGALDDLSPAPGKDFLEKIVQVGLDIPRIERTRLEQVLFNGLDRILGRQGLTAKFDQVRWANAFVPGLRPYFQNLRDAFRFLGTLEFHVSIFKKNGPLEVNPIDLIAVEALRVFEPAVYGRLHDAKALLTSTADREEKESVRKGVQDIVAAASEQNQPQVKKVLSELFPTIEWVFEGSSYGADWFEGWYRDLRICHRDVFDKYFYLTIPVGDIAQADIERLRATTGNRAELVAAFRALNEQDLLGVALDRFEAYKQTISLNDAVPFVTALFDIGDELPESAPGFTSLSPEMHLSRIIYWYLKQEKDRGKRAEVVKTAMRETTGLYAPILRTSLETRSADKKREEDAFLVSEEAVKELQAICLEKIKAAAESGALARHPQLASILYRWRDWASVEAPKAWAQRLIQSDEGILALLTAFLQQSTSQGMGDHTAKTHWSIRLSSLEPFVEIDKLEQRVNALPPREFSERQGEAIKQFQRAIKRRAQGKPDDDFWRDADED
jgi:predicted KAP-like P-loop ATPase